MKIYRHIALSAMLTLSAFTAITYTACTKDECKSVTCQNGGTCAGGTCSCPSGVGGSKCETIYSDNYAGAYIGAGVVISLTPAYSNDFSLMTLNLQPVGSTYLNSFTIILSNNTTSGSSFNIISSSNGYETYTGNGTITASMISFTLTTTESYTTTTTNTTTFTNLQKQ